LKSNCRGQQLTTFSDQPKHIFSRVCIPEPMTTGVVVMMVGTLWMYLHVISFNRAMNTHVIRHWVPHKSQKYIDNSNMLCLIHEYNKPITTRVHTFIDYYVHVTIFFINVHRVQEKKKDLQFEYKENERRLHKRSLANCW